MMDLIYSKKFTSLIQDEKKMEELMVGVHFGRGTYDLWFESRNFISQAIHHDGTILDIGCANGFLLLCLQEWTVKKLIPYGIDSKAEHIRDAKELYPDYKSNFLRVPLERLYDTGQLVPFGVCHWPMIKHIEMLSNYCFPTSFDFIYWNAWDNWLFSDINTITPLGWLMQNRVNAGGRIIIGLYDKLKENNWKRIENLKNIGVAIGGIIENPYGRSPIVVWIDKV